MKQQKKETYMEQLVRQTCRYKVTLFIGSGFSIKAGAPSVADLIKKLIEDAGLEYDRDVRNLSLREVSSDFERACGRNELMHALHKHFSFTPTDLSDHKFMASIPHFRNIFTTNYDTLIEDSYPRDKRIVITSSKGCAYDDVAPVKIYKLHGDLSTLNDPDSIIITDEDYERVFKNPNNFVPWQDLKYALLHTYVVFIGYSLADDNILEIVKLARKELKQDLKGLYLIAPYLPAARKCQLKRPSVGVKYIEGTGEDYLKALASKLNDTIIKDFKQNVVDASIVREYCRSKGIPTTIEISDAGNIIRPVITSNGAPITQTIKLKVVDEIGGKIRDEIFDSSFVLEGTNLRIPAIEINSSDLLDGEFRMNDILFENRDDWKSVLLARPYREREVTIKVPSIDFAEKTKCVTFLKEDNIIVHQFDVKIALIEFAVEYKDGEKPKPLDLSFSLTEKYASHSEALTWIEMLTAFYSGVNTDFEIFSTSDNGFDGSLKKKLERCIRYYKLIKDLEYDYKIPFSSYENYNQELEKAAVILYSYMTKHGYEYPLVKKISCEIDIYDFFEENMGEYSPDKKKLMAYSYENVRLCFNGIDLTIPFVNIVLQTAHFSKIQHIHGKRYLLEVTNDVENNLIYGSDTPVTQNRNTLTMQGFNS